MIGGFLVVILAFIGIMNFFNTTATSVISRKKELALLEVVGMTKKQVSKMLVTEGFLYLGGAFVIAVLLVGKREDMKQITKLSLAPGIFNINEPVIFGMPIMLNPILAIPFILTPLITGTIGYFATALGFAAKAVVMVPWPMPPIVNAYLATAGNIGAVITQLVCIIVSILIYLPFVKVANRVENDGI